MAISEELKRIYASAPSDYTYVNTLTFEHSLFSQLWAIANYPKEIKYRLETGLPQTFLPIPFDFILPANNSKGNQDLSFAICNIGREIMDQIELAIANPSEPIECVFRVYLDHPDTDPLNDPPIVLSVTQINFDINTVTASARRFDMLNFTFPRRLYEVDEFPGLRR